MSYHCSINAIGIPSGGKAGKRGFFPQTAYSEATNGWTSLSDLWKQIGFVPSRNDWRLATHFYLGQFRGLDRTAGILAAVSGSRCLVVKADSTYTIGNKDNFEKVEMEFDDFKVEKKKPLTKKEKVQLEYC